MIFEQLSLEFYLAGKNLPWTKAARVPKGQSLRGLNLIHDSEGFTYMVKADLTNAKSQYFNL